MARIESSSTLVGKKVTRIDGTVSKIVDLLIGGYKMDVGSKLLARNLVKQGGKFIEIAKTDIRMLVPHEGYVTLVAGQSAPVSTPANTPAAPAKQQEPEAQAEAHKTKLVAVSDRQAALMARRAKVMLAGLAHTAEGVAYSNFKSVAVTPVTAADGKVTLTVVLDFTHAEKPAAQATPEVNTDPVIQSRTRKWLKAKMPEVAPKSAFNYTALVGKQYYALGGFDVEQSLDDIKAAANKIARKSKEAVTGLFVTHGRVKAGTPASSSAPVTPAPVQHAAPAQHGPEYNVSACKGASEVVAKMKAYSAPSRRVLAKASGLALTDIKAGLVFVSSTGEEFVLDYSKAKDSVLLRNVAKAGRIISLDDGLTKFKKLGFTAKGVDDSALDAKH